MQSLVSASPRAVPWMRTTAASPPGAATVSAITVWSYCSQIQRREAPPGPPRMDRSAATGSLLSGEIVAGGAGGVGVQGRSYSGAPSASGRIGRSAAGRPCCESTMRPVSVSRPMTANSSPHFRNTASAASSPPGRSTISMRSWLSESMIS